MRAVMLVGATCPFCKKALPNAASDETRYAVLDSCLKHSHGGSVDGGSGDRF